MESSCFWDVGGSFVRIGLNGTIYCRDNLVSSAKGSSKDIIYGNPSDHNQVESKYVISRPIDRGCLLNKVQQENILKSNMDEITLGESMNGKSLLFIDKPLLPETSRAYWSEIIFESFGFDSYIREYSSRISSLAVKPNSANQANSNKCVVVLDMGCSFSTATAVFDNSFINLSALKRSTVGGKMLSNFYANRLTYHTIDVSRQPLLVERMSRDVFQLSSRPFELTQTNTSYRFPDYANTYNGTIEPTSDITRESNYCFEINDDQFLIPEAYFSPEIVGLAEKGLPSLIDEVITACPMSFRDKLKQNVVLIGGMSNLPNITNRLALSLGEDYKITKLNMSFATSLRVSGCNLKSTNPCFSSIAAAMLFYNEKQMALNGVKPVLRSDYLEKGHYNIKTEVY